MLSLFLVSSVTVHTRVCVSMLACVVASKISGGLHLTDAQKKLVEEDAGQTLAQQENMQISGSQARQMVMQRLLRASEVRLIHARPTAFKHLIKISGYAVVVHGCPKPPKNTSFLGVTQPPGVVQPLYSRGHN